jgi:hypothetical protein
MSAPVCANERLKYHEPGCDCGYLNPVTEWAGDSKLVIVAYECPKCKKRVPTSTINNQTSK